MTGNGLIRNKVPMQGHTSKYAKSSNLLHIMEVFALEILKAPRQKNAHPLADFL